MYRSTVMPDFFLQALQAHKRHCRWLWPSWGAKTWGICSSCGSSFIEFPLELDAAAAAAAAAAWAAFPRLAGVSCCKKFYNFHFKLKKTSKFEKQIKTNEIFRTSCLTEGRSGSAEVPAEAFPWPPGDFVGAGVGAEVVVGGGGGSGAGFW